MKPYLKINYLCRDIVRLHAHLCGDGCLYEKLEKPSRSNILRGRVGRFKRYVVDYSNVDKNLLDEFQRIIYEIAPLSYISRGNNFVRVRNKTLFYYMKSLGCGKTEDWHIFEYILKNHQYRLIWLAAFIDDEGCIKNNSIEIYTTNEKGKNQIIRLLKSENINCKIYIRRPSDKHPRFLYTISLSGLNLCRLRSLNLVHSKKKNKFKELIRDKCARRDLNSRIVQSRNDFPGTRLASFSADAETMEGRSHNR